MENWENITDAVFYHAAKRPNCAAIIDGGSSIDYNQFAKLIGGATIFLRNLGIHSGDRVAIAMTNSRDHVILAFAIMRLGAVLVEASVSDSMSQLKALAEKYEIRVLIGEANARTPPGVDTIKIDTNWFDAVACQTGDYRAGKRGDEFHIITLSSGSTGTPHGVMTSHRQLLTRFQVQRDLFNNHGIYDPADPGIFLLTASIRNSFFFRYFLAQIFVGGTILILPEYFQPIELVRTIRSWKDTYTVVTPNMCRLFLSAAPANGYLFPNLRALIGGGLPLYTDEKQALITRVTPNFYETYGTSGAGVVSCLNPVDIPAKSASVGRPVRGLEFDIVDDHKKSVAIGASGRLRLRGAALSIGYCHEDVGTSQEGFFDGWYYSGEIARFDSDGFLYILGRSSDLIPRGSFNIFPPEIEEIIAQHSTVQDVAVVGVPTTGIRQRIAAFVVARGGADRDQLAAYCSKALGKDKCPDWICFIDALPRVAGGKVDRVKLQGLAVKEENRRRPKL